MITLRTTLALCALLPAAAAMADPGDFVDRQRHHARVDAAFEAHDGALAEAFEARGAAWPPRGVFVRAFKAEGDLELWAEPAGDGERLVLVRTFPICRASGTLGPKLREGDLQVPEGFYAIDRFNPRSRFHLSLGLDYPNAVDRARAEGVPPGGDIFIHGDCVTVGCLPLEDGPASALYVVAVRARAAGQRDIPVHVFPCRFGESGCDEALRGLEADDEAVTPFWEVLERGYRAFEAHGRPPAVKAGASGYRITPRSSSDG